MLKISNLQDFREAVDGFSKIALDLDDTLFNSSKALKETFPTLKHDYNKSLGFINELSNSTIEKFLNFQVLNYLNKHMYYILKKSKMPIIILTGRLVKPSQNITSLFGSQLKDVIYGQSKFQKVFYCKKYTDTIMIDDAYEILKGLGPERAIASKHKWNEELVKKENFYYFA